MNSLQAGLPKCAIDCITESLTSTNCTIVDIPCICSHPHMWAEAYVCFDLRCTNLEKIVTGQAGVKTCNIPIRDRSASYDIIIGCLSALALCMVIARIWVRWSGHQSIKLGWDDAMLVICWITALPIAVVSGFLTEIGIGRDIWDFPLGNLDDFYLFFFYVEDISYSVETGLVKIAVLAFYIRIFPSQKFRRVCWSMIAFVALSTAVFTAVSIFYCMPISYAWHAWSGQSHGRCVNIQAVTIVQACLNLALEVILVALPMPTLYKLKTTIRKKLQILLLFSLGIILVIICILRIAALIQDYGIANITWHAWEQGLWDAAEVYVSIICVCLPAFKVFCERIKEYWEEKRKTSRVNSDPESDAGSGSTLAHKAMALVIWRKHEKCGERRERLPSVSKHTITKRTSTTIAWSHYDGEEPFQEVPGKSTAESPGADGMASTRPEWAAGWESGEVVRSHHTTVTAGEETGREKAQRPWYGMESRVQSWIAK